MSSHLVPEYHRARLLVVVSAALVFLWRLGIPFRGRIPLLDVGLLDNANLPYVLACVLGYGIFRLLVEWAQSERERRRRLASRIDLAVSLLFGASAAWVLGAQILPPISLSSIPLIPSFALIAVGIAVGELIDTSLFSLFFIRSKKEAKQLALPRVPVAVRAIFRTAYVVVPLLILTLLLAPSFSEPLSWYWPWLLFSPVLILVISGTAALGLRRHTRPDGTVISRTEYLGGLRAAFDQHDARYQIGGWDRPVAPSNTPLYEAAERGDSKAVQQLLSSGANPDEPNMHGWTALMIAVAQQHWDTAHLLLKNGANPDLSNLLGRNALMFAARYGNQDLLRDLIQHGARVDLNTSYDQGALASAAAHGHAEAVRILLDAGADPTRRDRDGKTARDCAEAAGHGEIAALIRRAALARHHET